MLAVVACAITLAGMAGHAQAQEQISSSISPLLFELTAKPGEELTNTVKITNRSPQAVAYTMQVESFVGNELGQATVTEGDPAVALKDWVSVSPPSFTLEPKEVKVVTFVIRIPADAEPGGRYASILASTSADKGAISGSGPAVENKLGALVLLSVQGQVTYQASVKEFKPVQMLYERSPITFETRIKNNSTVHIKPKGFIVLTNLFGKKVAQIDVEQRNILPKGERLLVTGYDQRLMGRYSASLFLSYGDKGDQLTDTAVVYVFPWKTSGPLLLGALVLLVLIVSRRKRFSKALRVLFGR